MPAPARRRYPLDDYYAVEAASPVRHEYFDGEIYAMAGGSVTHNRIVTNVLVAVGSALPDGCEVFASDLRVRTEDERYTYPDVTVICGAPRLLENRPDTVTNPACVVEVLSPSTRDYDRSDKLASYLTLPSLREVVLVEQDELLVEHVVRAGAAWDRCRYSMADDEVALTVGVRLPLRTIYRRVELPERPSGHSP